MLSALNDFFKGECTCKTVIIICISVICHLHNFDPLEPHFYIVKLGFTGVYIIFLILLKKNIYCEYSLELPHQGSSNNYPQSMFGAEIRIFY